MEEYSKEDIKDYLEKKFDNLTEEKEGWSLNIEGDVNTYPLKIIIQNSYLSLRVHPLGFPPKTQKCASNLNAYLLKANNSMEGACFATDDKGTPLLRTRIPLCSITEELLSSIFDTLLMHAEKHYLNVLNLARNENAAVELP